MPRNEALSLPGKLPGSAERRQRPFWAIVCVLLLALVAWLDYETGYGLNLSILYLASICLATWVYGRAAGVIFTLAAVSGWLAVDLLSHHVYAHPLYRYWEVVIRVVTWLGFALLLDRLKTALARSDERFVTVLARLHAAVYVADEATGELLYVNELCRESFGAELRHIGDIERRWSHAGQDAEGKAAAPAPQGDVQDAISGRWYLVTSRPIRWIDGRAVRLHIATDVTDRRRMEDLARRQQERLEFTARMTTLGEMASTLAHELNQPLAAITNYCNGCLRRLRAGEWKQGDLVDALEKTVAQAERAGGIIQRVREFPRKRDPDPRPCDINGITRAVAGMLNAEIERRGVRLRLELADRLPPALADRIMIEQVMINLVKNGLEAMAQTEPAARSLAIRTSGSASGRVTVEIEDRGIGLPQPLQKNLFIPYFTTKANGMGMGLHICRSIIERHGGSLTATAGRDTGTVLRFSLPAVAP